MAAHDNDSRDRQAIVEPGAPRLRRGRGAVDTRLDVHAQRATVVRAARARVADEPLAALPVASAAPRAVLPVMSELFIKRTLFICESVGIFLQSLST